MEIKNIKNLGKMRRKSKMNDYCLLKVFFKYYKIKEAKLTERERKIIIKYILKNHTYKELSEVYKITGNRIRQIKCNGMRKIFRTIKKNIKRIKNKEVIEIIDNYSLYYDFTNDKGIKLCRSILDD